MDYPGGPYEISDLQIIDREIRQIRVKHPLAEIGCWEGRSTSVLAKYAKECEQILYCIDPFFKNMIIPEFDYNMALVFCKNMMRLELFDTVRIIPLSSKTAAELPFGNLSILHIDGSHEFEDIKFDVMIFGSKTENLIICHDIDFEEIKEAICFIPNEFKLILHSEKMGIWKK